MGLSILALGLILAGTALGAYLSYNFEEKVRVSQDKIEKLNIEIEKVVVSSKELNKEILGITSNSKNLTQDVQTVTNNILEAQDYLKVISESTKNLSDKNIKLTEEVQEISAKTKELTNKNILVTEQSKKLIETLTNFQTGGDSYCEIELDYIQSTNRVHLNLFPVGSYTLRNVQITILDSRIKPAKINIFPIPQHLEGKVIYNKNGQLQLDMGDIRVFSGLELIFLDYNEFSVEFDFNIYIEAENFSTRQNLLVYDIASNEQTKRFSRIIINQGEMVGRVLSEKNYNFPINDKGEPIRKGNKNYQ